MISSTVAFLTSADGEADGDGEVRENENWAGGAVIEDMVETKMRETGSSASCFGEEGAKRYKETFSEDDPALTERMRPSLVLVVGVCCDMIQGGILLSYRDS